MISRLRRTNATNRDQYYLEVFEPIHKKEKKKRQRLEISGYVHSLPHKVLVL